MIKLLWNTQNQISSTKDNTNKEDARNYKWGLYHKENSDKWIYHLLEKIKYKIIENEKELETNDILIIVDSSVEKKAEFYGKLRLICSKIFLIHLGDEAGRKDLEQIYNDCNFVWRTFCSNKYFDNKKVACLPIGYKSGVKLEKEENNRKFKWAFLGTPHKSSRHDLLFQLSDVDPSFSHKTREFDNQIIEVKEMNNILSSTTFIPCPNGFVHPETYRLYEALECGCIPIVENSYKYFDRMYPNNPFLKIDKWLDAKNLINSWNSGQIKKKQEECRLWWTGYKKILQNSILERINL